jgi:hypothetical protein
MGTCLLSHCLAVNVYSSFQVSCHNMFHNDWERKIENVCVLGQPDNWFWLSGSGSKDIMPFHFLAVSSIVISEKIITNTIYSYSWNFVSDIKGRTYRQRVLRRIFWHKRDTVIGGFRKLHNEELCNMYSPPIVIKIIKLRKIRWPSSMHGGEEECI